MNGKRRVTMDDMKKTDYRVEKDSIGVKDIPEGVYYGVQTLRAAENFHITGLNMHPEIINSLAYIKKASAITNCEVGILEKKKAQAIVQACDEIIEGKFHDDFIVDPIQGATLKAEGRKTLDDLVSRMAVPDLNASSCSGL